MSIEQAAKMAGQWWAERLERGDKDRFASEIEKRVGEALQTKPYVLLECDYDPQGILLEAVRAIGIECAGFMFSARGILPDKHSLTVTTITLIPKEGYGRWTTPIDVGQQD